MIHFNEESKQQITCTSDVKQIEEKVHFDFLAALKKTENHDQTFKQRNKLKTLGDFKEVFAQQGTASVSNNDDLIQRKLGNKDQRKKLADGPKEIDSKYLN